MILQRLATSIRKQDWFTVVIETLIVVLGVYLGIQLGNWNTAQQHSAKEAIILTQLHDEFRDVAIELEQARPYADNTLEAVREVLRVIRSDVEPQNKADFLETLQLAGSFRSAPSEPVTLVELLSSGTLSDLSSQELRQALIQYHRTMQTHDEIAALILDRVSSPGEGFHDAIYVNPDHGPPDAPLLDAYDWEKMPATRQQFQVLYYGKSGLTRILAQLELEAEAVLEKVEEAQQ